MRRAVVLADVGLDLDDPTATSATIRRFTDEVGAEERRGDLERRPLEKRTGVVQERNTKKECRSDGMSSPNTFMKPGIRRVRIRSAVSDGL